MAFMLVLSPNRTDRVFADDRTFNEVFLSELDLFVKQRRRLRVVKNEADNRILECALAGRAEAIVTGDHALLAVREYDSVRIITLRDYLRRTT
jgi:predicted nucleic acid-binding protein